EGIRRFTALVAEDNVVMAGLLRNMSASLVGRDPGTAEYEITLMPPGAGAVTAAAAPPGRLRSAVPGRAPVLRRGAGRAREGGRAAGTGWAVQGTPAALNSPV